MLWFVLVASIVHFAAAAVLYYLLCGGPALLRGGRNDGESGKAGPAAATGGGDAVETCGAGWLERLKEGGIVPQSMVEAATHIAQLDANEYCDQLVAIEVRLRSSDNQEDSAEIKGAEEELRNLIEERLQRNEETATQIEQIKGQDEPQDLAESLEQVLLDEAAQIETTLSNLADDSTTNLINEVNRLISCGHTVRDGTVELLLPAIVDNPESQTDLDSVRELERQVHLVSEIDRALAAKAGKIVVAAVDVDQFCKVNTTFGASTGDRVIEEIESLIGEISVDAGEVRVDRRLGARYAVSFSGISKDTALAKLELMCQLVSATTFTCGDISHSPTATGALVECGPKTRPLDLLGQLDQLVVDARRAGPNRIAVAGKAGSSTFEIKSDEQPARTVSIES